MQHIQPNVRLKLPAQKGTAIEPLERIVERYAEELDKRKVQLSQDLRYYKYKLAELKEIDPLDFTGLTKIYRQHVARIEALLNTVNRSEQLSTA